MREAEEKEQKTKVSEVAKSVERRKKSNGASARPESATNSKERRVNNALSARRRPPRLVWSEERERKRTLGSPISTLCLRMSECRNAGAEKRERAEASGGERKTVRQHGGNGGVIHGSFALEFGRERKQW